MHLHKESDERLHLTFADISTILRRSKKQILYFALTFAFFAIMWTLLKPVSYLGEGTFREKGVKPTGLSASSSIVNLLNMGNGMGGNESEASSLMVSRTILKEVAKKNHLQGSIQAQSAIETIPSTIKSNLLLAWASLTNTSKPVLKDIRSPLYFTELTYSGELPLSFKLEMEKGGIFKLYDTTEPGELIGKGEINKPFYYKDLSFTLALTDPNTLTSETFVLAVNPLVKTTKNLEKALTIEPSKLDKSLLKIQFLHRNRHLASDIVNDVMENYQAYSQKYHTQVATKQLDYLSQRRDQLSNNLVNLMERHADFLANDLYSSGFIESNKEMDFLAKSQHEYKRRLLDNELEIKRLSKIKPDNFAHYERYSANEGDLSIINNIFSEMRMLKQQRDGLEIDIQKKTVSQGTNFQHFFDKQFEELQEVQKSLTDIQAIHAEFEKGILLENQSSFLEDPRFLLKGWTIRLQNARLDGPKAWNETKENFLFYLKNLERLFGVHERILQERLTHQQNSPGEYQGISLEVATDLYRDYSKQLIEMENTIRQNKFFIHQIEDPNFEITSLSAGLNDPISNEIILKAGQLVLNLRDQNNQSNREQERIKEELQLERTFLTLHLQQIVQLMELNKQLIDEKLFALQNISLELIHQRISLLEKNLQDYLHSRLHNLEQERQLIKRHLENIHSEMAQLPKKWVSEQLLTQEVTTNHLIVEEIAKLVETKNISHNLEVIQSAPVDLALPPLHPVMPKLILFGLLGFFLGGSFGACFALGRTLSHGLPLTPAHVEQLNCHASGWLTAPLLSEEKLMQPSNFETLRRLQLYFDSARAERCTSPSADNKLILLIEGKGPNYAPFLADLLAKRKRRILTLYLDEPEGNENRDADPSNKGLIDYLNGKCAAPSIQKGDHGDWIAAGQTTPFLNEMINSKEFNQLIDQLHPLYDWILVVSHASIGSVEAEHLTHLSSFIALTADHEHVKNLNFYLQLRKNSPETKLTFLFH